MTQTLNQDKVSVSDRKLKAHLLLLKVKLYLVRPKENKLQRT